MKVFKLAKIMVALILVSVSLGTYKVYDNLSAYSPVPDAIASEVVEAALIGKSATVHIGLVNPKTGRFTGKGSGFFITPSGYIITAKHVLGSDGVYAIRTSTGKLYYPEYSLIHVRRDLALVKITPKKDVPYLLPGLATSLSSGDTVVVVGYPASNILKGEP